MSVVAKRLLLSARILLLLPGIAAAQMPCGQAEVNTISGAQLSKGQAVTMSVTSSPCHTLSIQVTASASNPTFGAAVSAYVYNSSDDELWHEGWSFYTSATRTLPAAAAPYVVPFRATVGSKGNLSRIVFKCTANGDVPSAVEIRRRLG